MLIGIIQKIDFELAEGYSLDIEGKNFNGAFSVKPYGMFATTKKRET
jgi:hypothetical protein